MTRSSDAAPDMLGFLRSRWWVFALRGVAALVFGIAALALSGLTLTGLLTAYGVFLIADGLLAIGTGFSNTAIVAGRGWWLSVAGAVGVACGAAMVLAPGFALTAFLYLIGSWLVGLGIVLVVAALQIRRETDDEWILTTLGALSILIGGGLFLFPHAGTVFIAWVLATYALVSGALLLAFAWRVRSLENMRGL